ISRIPREPRWAIYCCPCSNWRAFSRTKSAIALARSASRKQGRYMKKAIVIASVSILLSGATAFAQQAAGTQMNPTPGCSATPAQLEANKKAALEFFRPGADRVALADPTYKQHNPAFKKRAEDKKV